MRRCKKRRAPVYLSRVIDHTKHDDVDAMRLSWRRSRVGGYSVFAYRVRGVLIDCGFPGVAPDIAALVRESRPRGVLLTHQHEDHAGNIEMLVQAGLPVGVSDATLTAIRVQHRIGLYRHFTWSAMRPLHTPITPFVDDSLQLIFAPGHSPDHHVVWDDLTHSLFAGDLFLGVKVRVMHAYESPADTVASIRALLLRHPKRVFCMHRGLLADGARALSAKADWMERAIEQIVRLSLKGHAFAEIRRAVLGPRGLTHYITAGDYSPDNFVRAALRDHEISLLQ